MAYSWQEVRAFRLHGERWHCKVSHDHYGKKKKRGFVPYQP
jgi:hypothetical protein